MIIQRILYTSLVDVSVPYGPGVNERGFIKDMAKRFGGNFKAVIPRPSKGLPGELHKVNISYLNYLISGRNIFGWIETRLIGCLRLKSIISEYRPNLIVMRLGALPLPAFFCVLPNSVPYALKTAGVGSFERFYKTNPLRRITAGSNEYILNKMLTHCIAVDVVTDVQRKSLIESYPQVADRAFVIDNGVDLEMFPANDGSIAREKFSIAADDIVFGYVGGFPMRRGGKATVDLVKYLHDHVSLPVKGIIVGDSGEAEQCRQYARQSGISELITVTGQVSYEEVPELMSAMDVGLSILRPQEQHASEQKVRQYLAAGLCVIGTRGSNDFLRDHDFARVISGDTVSEIADAALSLLDRGRAGLKERAKGSKRLANKELSIESRDNYRLKLWTEALDGKP